MIIGKFLFGQSRYLCTTIHISLLSGMNITSFSRYFVSLFCLLAFLPVGAQIEVERLPDLNISRAGHSLFYVNGEYVVAGGHTDGFVPTPTAEYYKDGKWHTMQMTYIHDFGISVVLRSGKVLLAGGCEQPTGIGQTYTAEIYDPATHTFRGFGNMQQKRVWASALELDSGQVVISGNWYNTDGIELFHEHQAGSGDFLGKSSFTYVKDVTAPRSMPYIFRIAKDDALIIGSNDIRGESHHFTFADRLKGDTVHIPLFEKWQPIHIHSHHDEGNFIGDMEKGDYTYLLPVRDSTGQVAIARVSGTHVSLLPTASAIPMEHEGEQIEYVFIVADRQNGCAYLIGINNSHHTAPGKVILYILRIDYAHASEDSGAPLQLYCTDSMGEVVPYSIPVLTPEGNLLIAGGTINNSNYSPSAAVWLVRMGATPEVASSGYGWWVWLLLALLLVGLVMTCLLVYKRHKTKTVEKDLDSDFAVDQTTTPSESAALMQRIVLLMEEQKYYLKNDLKLSDVATALSTNRNVISNCINSQGGCSFSQFVNSYRINHAKELMRRQPDIKIVEVWMASGFTTESNFFRAFKAFTGMTPKEWTSQYDLNKVL